LTTKLGIGVVKTTSIANSDTNSYAFRFFHSA